jgi:CRP/FNR family transcriptional regulator, cyclic AMP receptor protein
VVVGVLRHAAANRAANSKEAVVKASSYDEILTFEDGEIIAREGEETRDMYVVQDGTVEVLKEIEGEQVLLAVLERGSFFGEMSLLESLPRSATVRARGRAKLLAIRAGSLLLKIRRDPSFAFEMLQQMSGRIRRLNEQLADILRSAEPSGTDPRSAAGMLVVAAEYELAAEAGRPEVQA